MDEVVTEEHGRLGKERWHGIDERNGGSKTSSESRRHQALTALCAMLCVYLFAAYLLVPEFWSRYIRRHPAFADVPGITHTRIGLPGDPINVGLIGTREELVRGMLRAGWFPADPITLETSLRIATDAVFKRRYEDAPVSSLYLFGRKEDLAFEQPVGPDPRRRNHVRFWNTDQSDPASDRPVWIGSATYDRRVGFSHTTGEITHHIAPDIDSERNHLFQNLREAGAISGSDFIPGFHRILHGRNGGNDPWFTDGKLEVGVLVPAAQAP
jgi:hypothetical protein